MYHIFVPVECTWNVVWRDASMCLCLPRTCPRNVSKKRTQGMNAFSCRNVVNSCFWRSLNGRWYIITQLAVYTTYIPLIYMTNWVNIYRLPPIKGTRNNHWRWGIFVFWPIHKTALTFGCKTRTFWQLLSHWHYKDPLTCWWFLTSPSRCTVAFGVFMKRI